MAWNAPVLSQILTSETVRAEDGEVFEFCISADAIDNVKAEIQDSDGILPDLDMLWQSNVANVFQCNTYFVIATLVQVPSAHMHAHTTNCRDSCFVPMLKSEFQIKIRVVFIGQKLGICPSNDDNCLFLTIFRMMIAWLLDVFRGLLKMGNIV